MGILLLVIAIVLGLKSLTWLYLTIRLDFVSSNVMIRGCPMLMMNLLMVFRSAVDETSTIGWCSVLSNNTSLYSVGLSENC